MSSDVQFDEQPNDTSTDKPTVEYVREAVQQFAMTRRCLPGMLLMFAAATLGLETAGASTDEATSAEHSVAAALCPLDTIRELCAPATAGADAVTLDCSVDFHIQDCRTLPGAADDAENRITRRIRLLGAASSDVHIDLAGAHIDAGPDAPLFKQGDIVEIASVQQADGRWDAPENIVVRNARVTGSMRVFGMGRNGEAVAVRESSQRPGHVQRLRRAAPKSIVLDQLSIVGTGRNPLYVGPGVVNLTLQHSSITGRSDRVGIYLDAESTGALISDNEIAVRTSDGSVLGFYDRGWPQIAIDTSSDNRIIGNRFEQLQNGGIFLYRNCGEGGTIRHGSPSRNRIEDNDFIYQPGPAHADIDDPAVLIGSRNYGWLEEYLPGSHCNDDAGKLATGSATSNADHAIGNHVIGNRLHASGLTLQGSPKPIRQASTLVRVQRPAVNRDNVVSGNQVLPVISQQAGD